MIYRAECFCINMALKLLFVTLILLPCGLFSDTSSKRENRFTVKVAVGFFDEIKELLDSQGFKLLSKISPETFVVQFRGEDDGKELMANIMRVNKNKIVAWEPVRVYTNTIIPAHFESKNVSQAQPNLVCSHYYGMGVEDVWKHGYTGLNIKIAITDVGINTDLLDLKKNVNTFWSYNFVDDNNDVTPAYYPDPATFNITNHGNMVASVVAAEKDNEICAAGIAYDATILAFKVFKMENSSHNNNSTKLQLVTDGHILSSALVHRLNNIDIFVNAWYPTIPFDGLDLLTLDAIERGATRGRGGLGIVYVVPSGIPGNALSNNIYTITVGGVGKNGSLLSDIHRFVDASILVSAPAEGNNLTSERLITISYPNNCTSSFKGLSAATAITGGIIALGLQANVALSLRDVQHLLVISSEYDCLLERDNFKPNGAGLYYHGSLGFGLINASKFVNNALMTRGFPRLLEKRLNMEDGRMIDTKTSKVNEMEFCYNCQDLDDEDCLTSVEHVSAYITMKVYTKELSVRIQSPRGTQSTLIKESNMHSEVKGSFVSAHFWNEEPAGQWKIILQRDHVKDILQVLTLSLTLYGFHDKHKSNPSIELACKETDKLVNDRGKKDKPEETTSKGDGSIIINNNNNVNNNNNNNDKNMIDNFIATYVTGFVITVVFVIVIFIIKHTCKTRNEERNNVHMSATRRLLKMSRNAGNATEDYNLEQSENTDTRSAPRAADKKLNNVRLNEIHRQKNEDRKLDNQSKEKIQGEEYEELV